MASWLTQEGLYYEADFKIQPTDLKVPPRPGINCNFINGNWVQYHAGDADQYQQPDEVHIHRIQLKTNPHSLHHPNEPIYREAPYHYQPIIEKEPEQKPKSKEPAGDSVVLTNNTKVMFGIRELVVVAAFVVTATISWQDTNARIMKLEDNKSMEIMDAKIKSLELEIKAMDKQARSDNQKVELSIRELEQVIFMKNKR